MTEQEGAKQARVVTGAGSQQPSLARVAMDGTAVPPASRWHSRSGLIASVVAAAVATAIVSAWIAAPAGQQGDVPLTAAELTAQREAFAAQGSVAFKVVPAADQGQALAGMQLPPAEQAALAEDLARPDHQLVYLTVWDDRVEDGDALDIEGSGFSQRVALTKAPQRFAVPLAGGTITLRGVRDGGGGITLGAQADGGSILVPVLAPGETAVLAVAAR